MPGTFQMPASAFAPFFDEVISVEGRRSATLSADGAPAVTRNVSGSFYACVFDNGFADPLADADAESGVRTFSITVRAGDWIEGTKPQTGDRVHLADGTLLAVNSVGMLAGDTWVLTAREVKK